MYVGTKWSALAVIGTLAAACSPAPDAAHVTAPDPTDPFLGTWVRNGEATLAASEVFLKRGDSGAIETEAARRAEIVDAPWKIVTALDGTLTFDALVRKPGASALTEEHWTGTWKNDAGAVQLVVQTGAADELTRLTGRLEGDRLTIGGPPGNPRGLVLQFDRRSP